MKIGIQELLLVFIVALIVLGPDKLPLYARKFGEALREFRKFSSDATKDIRESIVEPLEEAQRPLREALEPITELEKEVRGDVEGIQKSLSDISKPAKKTPETESASENAEDLKTAEQEADDPGLADNKEPAAEKADGGHDLVDGQTQRSFASLEDGEEAPDPGDPAGEVVSVEEAAGEEIPGQPGQVSMEQQAV